MREQQEYGFVSLMSTNLCAPGENMDLKTIHVLPEPLRKLHQARCSGARSTTVWGTGTRRREFLCSEDIEDACLFALQEPEEMLYQAATDGLLNVGAGQDAIIVALVDKNQAVVGTTCTVCMTPQSLTARLAS